MYLLNTTPLGPYHHLMYGRSLWFDISKAKKDLGFSPKYSSDEMILNSYKHYLSDNNVKKNIDELSHHKSNVKKKLLYFAPTFINLIGKKIK